MFRKFTSEEMNEVNSLVEGISNPQFETEDEEEWTAEFMRIARLPIAEAASSPLQAKITAKRANKTQMEKELEPIHRQQKNLRDTFKNAKDAKGRVQARRQLQKLAIQVRKIREKHLGKSKGGKVGGF